MIHSYEPSHLILTYSGEEVKQISFLKLEKNLNLIYSRNKEGCACFFLLYYMISKKNQKNYFALLYYLYIQIACPNQGVMITKTLREELISVRHSFSQQILTNLLSAYNIPTVILSKLSFLFNLNSAQPLFSHTLAYSCLSPPS